MHHDLETGRNKLQADWSEGRCAGWSRGAVIYRQLKKSETGIAV